MVPTIHRAKPSDVEQLSYVCSRTFIDTYGQSLGSHQAAMAREYVKETFSIDALRRELAAESGETWIAVVDTTIAGYVKIGDDHPPEVVAPKNLINLDRLYVLKEHHGAGLGRLLLATAESRAKERGAGGIWLGVWEENAAAIAFYARHGYTKVGRRTWEYVRDGIQYRDFDDIMVKAIQR